MPVKEYLEDLAGGMWDNFTSLSQLTFDQANQIIVRLGGTAFPKRGLSKRTENRRKQQAGIKTVETDRHLNFIDELARLRNMSPEGLENLAKRMIGHWPPRTTEEGNKMVEALKAMNRREGLLPTPGPKGRKHQPKFRRVA